MPEEPKTYNEKIAEYLTQLRDGGTINMMAAVPYLQRRFNMDKDVAEECLFYWMDNC